MSEKNILDLFVKYSSLKYFEKYIDDDLTYLSNFDLDSKDIKNISERIQEIEIIIAFIKKRRKGGF